MSEISSMNATIRRRVATGGAALAVIAALAIAPDSAISLIVDTKPTPGLWWAALTIPFVAIALLLEALDLGRHSKHRTDRIDNLIVRRVLGAVCSKGDCPMREEPNNSVRQSAVALFYKHIDTPSREVAFFQWAWYFTARMWTSFAVGALLVAIIASRFVETDARGLRWSAITLLAAAALTAFGITKIWERKTLSHVGLQLTQIGPNLGTKLEGATCPDPHCPAT
jgi:hypothetical protein